MYLRHHGRRGVYPALAELRALDYSRKASAEIARRQQEKLVAILRQAYDNSPWYREKFISAGVKREDIRNSKALSALPILTRSDMYDHMDSILSTAYPRNQLLETKTGGSTMEPLIFYRDPYTLDYRIALELFLAEVASWRIGEWWVNIWGSLSDIPDKYGFEKLKYTIANSLSRRMLAFDSTFLSEDDYPKLAKIIQRKNVTLLFGYPRGVAGFARWAIDHRPDLQSLRGVICTAEPLAPEDRAVMREAFPTPIYDRYASREVGMISQECGGCDGLHILTDNVFVEFAPHSDDSVDPEAGGRIIITDLVNTGMPLIRYDTGDVARALPTPARSCGCRLDGLPLMSAVVGRFADFLVRNDGTRFVGLDVPGMRMAEQGWVKQIQYVQTDIDTVTVRLIRGRNFSEAFYPYIQKQVDHVFKSHVQLTFTLVESIPRTRSGKSMYSICQIPPQRIAELSQSARS